MTLVKRSITPTVIYIYKYVYIYKKNFQWEKNKFLIKFLFKASNVYVYKKTNQILRELKIKKFDERFLQNMYSELF